VKTRSIQIPWLAEAILKHGKAFTAGEGKNMWDGEMPPKFLVCRVLIMRRSPR
jgi:hypothetical protein